MAYDQSRAGGAVRASRPIPREAISQAAFKVVAALRDAGYVALLVGGCVRDLMLGREPKDFDVVTSAKPEEIKALFRSARLIGRRFRLAHVRVGRDIIEVATFRGAPSEPDENGFVDHNVFGTQEEDAVRRDFTVNALYYDIESGTVSDFVGGLDDLNHGVLRTIGDAETRYREDPVRMLRAVRFAAKLGFRLDPATASPLPALAPLLRNVAPARLFEEVLKLFHAGAALETYEMLRHYGLFQYLFPHTERSLEVEREGFPLTLLVRALANTDKRVAEDKPVTPAFLFAALLWEPVRLQVEAQVAEGARAAQALARVADSVLREQARIIAVPKRFSFPAREIWEMQQRFDSRHGRQPLRLLGHKRFRAAYDFLLLRADSGEEDPQLAEWWTRFQAVTPEEREQMIAALPPQTSASPRRRRRGRRAGGGR